MFTRETLFKLTQTPMPFGRYRGTLLIELPEEYLLWFARKGFPEGQLGELMSLTLEIKIEGLDYLLKPLIQRPPTLGKEKTKPC